MDADVAEGDVAEGDVAEGDVAEGDEVCRSVIPHQIARAHETMAVRANHHRYVQKVLATMTPVRWAKYSE